jgi:hypothetical protein
LAFYDKSSTDDHFEVGGGQARAEPRRKKLEKRRVSVQDEFLDVQG